MKRNSWALLPLFFLLTACPESREIKDESINSQQVPSPTPTVAPTPVATATSTPAPSPTATATPTPEPKIKGALRTSGRNFIDIDDKKVYLLGAVVCCEMAKENGWPFVSDEMLARYARHKANYTHVRIGPNTPDSEGTEFGAYKDVGNNKVDLNQWNPEFWAKLRHVISKAGELGIYVEITLIDAWVLERPELSAWYKENNINGVDVGNCNVLKKAPGPVHEKWLRKIAKETGEFNNVIYEVGNETFDCGRKTTVDWEVGVARIIRNELDNNSFHTKPIGTNSHKDEIEDHDEIDYINRHGQELPTPKNKPIMVNEYNGRFAADQGPDGFERYLRNAYNRDVMWHLWRGNMLEDAFFESLNRLKKFREEVGD